jgi:hypothetical protein
LKSLDDLELAETSKNYALWGHETFFTMLRLLTIFGNHAKKHQAQRVFAAFDKAFLESVQGTPDEIRRFSTVFMYYPALVYRYLTMSGEGAAAFLHEKLSGQVWDPQVAVWQKRLCDFLGMMKKLSRYFRRVADRVCGRHPECFIHFAHLDELERVARGMLAALMRLPSYEEQREELGNYYDVQLLRIGLGTLHGLGPEQLDAEFTEVSDQYIRTLFDICKSEVDRDLHRRIFTHDRLAVFLAGGHARERAHQDDYDLLVLLNSDSQEMLDYSSKILTRLNREIVKRGIIPQYRLGDIFGGYVTRFSDLERHLKENFDEAFIETSQLLGARMIVGSSRLDAEFRKRIIQDCIYARKKQYFQALAQEVMGRRLAKGRLRDAVHHDVKESEGGQRDIEMAMLLLKVLHEIEGPLGVGFLNTLAARRPAEKQFFLDLLESYQFLNRLRDIYRLTVSPINSLDPANLEQPALLLGYSPEGGRTAGEKLCDDFRLHCSRSAQKLYALIDLVLKQA